MTDIDSAAIMARHVGHCQNVLCCSGGMVLPKLDHEYNNGHCELYRLAEAFAAVANQRDEWRDAARKDWVDEASARTMRLKDEIEELKEKLELAEEQIEHYEAPFRVQPPSSSLRPM